MKALGKLDGKQHCVSLSHSAGWNTPQPPGTRCTGFPEIYTVAHTPPVYLPTYTQSSSFRTLADRTAPCVVQRVVAGCTRAFFTLFSILHLVLPLTVASHSPYTERERERERETLTGKSPGAFPAPFYRQRHYRKCE